MNHLAHFYLARPDPELMVGAIVADYARGEVAALPYTEGIKKGIALHRFIDTFTDNHAAVRRMTELLHPTQHKYAPIVVDVCFDYFLATDWARYAPDCTLAAFSKSVCAILLQYEAVLPTPLQARLPKMVANNFLVHYNSYDGLRYAFESIHKRTSFASALLTATDDFVRLQPEMQVAFDVFFAELRSACREAYGEE